MKKWSTAVIMIGLVSVVFMTAPRAQEGKEAVEWKGSGGWGRGGQQDRMYDPKTVETLHGEVVSVNKIPAAGRYYGVHVTLKTDKETIPVHLGPGWFIEHQDTKIEPQDKVEITGSRVVYEGEPAVIAAEVTKGDEVLKLRDENGLPFWAGWRKR